MDEVKFSSLTAEAKYHILNYLSENRDAPHSCFEITQAVQHQNKVIRVKIAVLAHTARSTRATLPKQESHLAGWLN